MYAQSQVRALRSAGHDLHVLSGRPADDDADGCREAGHGAGDVASSARCHVEEDSDGVIVWALTLPRATWGRLDRHSGWRAFARAAGTSPDLTAAVAAFAPDVVLGVDWSSLPAWSALRATLVDHLSRMDDDAAADGSETGGPPAGWVSPPFVYSNFRVFSRTDDAHAALEAEAVAAASAVIALCDADADVITHSLAPAGVAVCPAVILPPLRADVRRLAVDTQDPVVPSVSPGPSMMSSVDAAPTAVARLLQTRRASPSGRVFVTCCVRLSPEKEPERFIELVEELARRGVFRPNAVVPLLCGATGGEYAGEIKRRFEAAATPYGGVVVETFLDAAALGEVYRASLLNVHPCGYDAYGMTVVEAAAFGTPSVVQRGERVGCTALLKEHAGEFFPVDLEGGGGSRAGVPEKKEKGGTEGRASTFADAVEGALRAGWDAGCTGCASLAAASPGTLCPQSLAAVGAAARRRVLAWDEAANAEATADILRRAVDVARLDPKSRDPSAGGGDSVVLAGRSVGRWSLPGTEEQARLRPLWRTAVLAFWVPDDAAGSPADHPAAAGGWVTLQATEAAPIDAMEEASSSSVRPGAPRVLNPGEYLVLTAYNPMGTQHPEADNVAAQRQLAARCADMYPRPASVLSTLSVDPEGGAGTWSEPGLALRLPGDAEDAASVRRAATRLARRYGQAAVYVLEGDGVKWRMAVRPCFPGLDGLASDDVAMTVRAAARGMPAHPLVP